MRLLNENMELNLITKDDPFSLPNISDTLANLSDKKNFSTVDMDSGYYQVDIREENIPKTGFVILGEHYEFLRLPMGQSTAPKTFQKIVSRIFHYLPYVKTFLDDFLIASASIEEHCEHVVTVLQRLREEGGTFNMNKSQFFYT